MTAFVGGAVSLLGLGFVMGFSPGLYAFVVRLLTQSPLATTAIRWICVGLGLGALILLLAFRILDLQTLSVALRDDATQFLARRSTDATAAVLFCVAGIVMAVQLRKPPVVRHAEEPARAPRPGRMLSVGLAESIVSLSGLATMYVTGRVILSGSDDLLLQGVLAAIFFTVLVGQYLLLAWAWKAFPTLARVMTRIYDWAAGLNTRLLLVLGLFAGAVTFGVLAAMGR